MRKKQAMVILTGVLIVSIGLYLLLNYLISTPSGCQSTSGIFMGGCFGKNLNRNFHISQEIPSCLKIQSHTCQYAQLEIENLCLSSEKITIQGIPITDKYTYLLFGLDNQGKVVNIKSGRNHYPVSDENISLNMRINDKDYSITYIRTKPLCK